MAHKGPGCSAAAEEVEDPYEAKLARLVAGLAPGERAADARAVHEGFTLLHRAREVLRRPKGSVDGPGLAHAAADCFRGVCLFDAVLLLNRFGCAASALEVVHDFAADDVVEPAVHLLRALWLYLRASAAQEAEAPPRVLQVILAALERAAELWTDDARVAGIAAGLAAWGVPAPEQVCADARFAMLRALAQMQTALGDAAAAAATLERACEGRPLALMAANSVAIAINSGEAPGGPRRAYGVALRALQRAEAAGHDHMAAQLAHSAMMMVTRGALGATFTSEQMRPLGERARRALEAARPAVPVSVWASADEMVRDLEPLWDAAAPRQTYCAIREQLTELRGDLTRTCARPACGRTMLEMRACACRAARYCSPACQRAHWPEHRRTCAARSRAAA